MSSAQVIPLAFAGWWVAMCVVMMVCMGAMMLGMGRMGGRTTRARSAPRDGLDTRESPVETLDRRFAEGEISLEDYRARREALLSGSAKAGDAHEDEPLTTA